MATYKIQKQEKKLEKFHRVRKRVKDAILRQTTSYMKIYNSKYEK